MLHQQEVLLAVKMFAESVNSGQKVVADMSSLVEATSLLPLENLDKWERLLRWEFSNALEATSPPKWNMWSKPTQFLTWIDLCSLDGFRREKTLRTLSGAAPNSFFFALAIRRLNDWVPQVREAAREKLVLLARETKPEHVVDVLCVTLSHWNSWGRMKDEDRQVLLEIISISEVREALKNRVISATSGPMATVLSQTCQTDVLDNCLHEIAKVSIQPAVRAKAYRCLLEEKVVWFAGRKWVWTDKRYCEGRLRPKLCERPITVASPFLQTLKSSAIDHSPMVRRVAGEMLIKGLDVLGPNANYLAELLSTDSSLSVAERGRFALNRLSEH